MSLFRDKRRKQFVIDPAFQYRFMITWLIMTLFFVAVIVVGLMIGLKMAITSETYGLSEIGLMLKADAVFIVFFTIAVGIYFLILSHRIAGPAFRLEKSVKEMIKGNYDFTVSLRQKDYMKRVADDLNDLIMVLKEKRKVMKTIEEDFQSLKNNLNQQNLSSENKEAINKIEGNISRLLSYS